MAVCPVQCPWLDSFIRSKLKVLSHPTCTQMSHSQGPLPWHHMAPAALLSGMGHIPRTDISATCKCGHKLLYANPSIKNDILTIVYKYSILRDENQQLRSFMGCSSSPWGGNDSFKFSGVLLPYKPHTRRSAAARMLIVIMKLNPAKMKQRHDVILNHEARLLWL